MSASATLFLPDGLVQQLPDRVIWVSNSGNDESGDGSQNSPYLTTNKAFSVYPDQVQINLVSGTYNVSVPSNATSVAVLGVPEATLGWFNWTQSAGASPLSIYLANVNLINKNASTVPILTLQGQLHNATLVNVVVNSTSTAASGKLVLLETGPLPGSFVRLAKVNITHAGSALSVSVSGFDSAQVNNLFLSGTLGVVGFKHLGETHVVGGTWNARLASIRFVNNRRLTVSKLRTFNVELRLANTLSASITDSDLFRTEISTGSDDEGVCLTAVLSAQITRSYLEDCSFALKWTGSACNPSLYLPSFIRNTISRSFETTLSTPLNARGNWWGAYSGPTICSNPGGSGARIGPQTDYSSYCEDSNCNTLSAWPQLLPQVLSNPCRSPTGGDIATFTVIFFLFVAVHVAMLVVYCMYCRPRKTDTQSIQVHYARMSARMSLVAAICIVGIAVAGAIGSAACPTRVYAANCPFTLTDRAVAGNGLLFASVTVLVAVASVILLRYNFHEQRPILYTCLAYQGISLALSVIIIIISLMGLSSPLYGPYMHLLAVPAAGYIIFSVIQVYHLDKLRPYCRHTLIALEVADYRNEHASLLHREPHDIHDNPPPSVTNTDDESDSQAADSSAGETHSIQQNQASTDEYAVPIAPPMQVFYSNYMRVTIRWLVAENVTCAALLCFAIWYTVTSYKVIGALLITGLLLEYFRIVAAIYVIRGRGPIMGFKGVMIFTFITKIALVMAGGFLYVQTFTLSGQTSAYFTAAFIAPILGLGAITTIRIWKMFEAVFAKKAKLLL